MNKILVVAMLSAMLTNNLRAQKTKDSLNSIKAKDLKLDYLRKSKDQKVFAYTLLATGLTLGTLGGLGLALADTFGSTHSSSGSSEMLLATSAVALMSSIILFNEAAKNKKRAKLVVGNQQTLFPKSLNVKQTTIGLAIPLGK